MKTNHLLIISRSVALVCALAFVAGCERDIEGLEPATYSTDPEVFIDDFSAGLNYAAFGGSVPTAFDVDKEVTYNGSKASIRFEVPDFEDPRGAYAGGVFFTSVGRDLTGYNALTFWAKASQAATIDQIGFGNDFGELKYLVAVSGLKLNASWKKYIIPIPDPSRLTQERGMLFCSEGPEDGLGYTFWIDEVKFEKLGTLAHPQAAILNGEDREVTVENGQVINISEREFIVNLPDGTNFSAGISPSYLTFISSNPAVASVAPDGTVNVLSAGTATITAQLAGQPAKGSLAITCLGEPNLPATAAPVPTFDPSKVISLYSNAYDNVPVDTWNTHWLYSTAEEFFIKINGDDVIRYRNLNFVGIEFTSEMIDATAMTHFYLNLWTPDPTALPKTFKVMLVDFGADGAYGGGDDKSHEIAVTSPTLVTENWITLNIPLSSFTGLTNRNHLAQLVLSGDLPNVYIDNVLFYTSGTVVTAPTTPAPTPTYPPADVISIFSDTYTNVPGTNLNPGWGQATVVSQLPIGGNNTMKYAGLNYQGIELGSALNVSSMVYFHLDFWTANSTSLKVFLISPGPVETPYTLTVPTTGWSSIDIPLTSFAPVDLSNVFQLKFEGNGDIYLDNLYFRK
ncbi:MAG TPA: hypothetical protein P5550_03120 [Bacteroidales bacterium]|nr:hypothetical protein [Bacteroidales bacterium]HRZ76738.1 hypothetical protein [Bacteroidales bacterium]